METRAVFLNGPKDLHLDTLSLKRPGAADIVVDIAHSGISTGTEKLFWTGEMPPFPGSGYPLVPGYEAAGEVVEAGPDRIVATMEITERHHQPFGIVHGGVYCAVGESVASMSGFLWLQDSGIGGTAVGVNNNTDFLRSVRAGTGNPEARGRVCRAC